MDISSKSMAYAVYLIVFLLLFNPASTHSESKQEGYISAVISDKGLGFAKDLLIEKAISSIIPLQLDDIEKSKKIPVIGKVDLGLSNIIIDRIDVASSSVETGESGIVLIASGATASLSMEWGYSYKTWVISVSDKGSASVQVVDMVVELNVALINEERTLKLILLDCGCDVKDISIDVHGGASWLYQGIIDAFQKKIVSAVENAIVKKIKEGIIKLDSRLQSLPKQVQINDVVELNVTFVDDPVLSNTSVELEINGLFIGTEGISDYYNKGSQAFLSSTRSTKMVEVSLHENVFDSAASAYFNGNYMHFTIEKVPDQSLMNTDGWRDIIPQLYEQYPDDEMNFSMTVSSPPVMQIVNNDIDTTIYADLVMGVLNSDKVLPVACVSLAMSASCSAEIYDNKLAGSIKLVNFTAALKWSDIGNLRMHLVQAAMSTILETYFVPYLNLHLREGLPFPLPKGVELQNAKISLLESRVTIYTDVGFTDEFDLKLATNLFAIS